MYFFAAGIPDLLYEFESTALDGGPERSIEFALVDGLLAIERALGKQNANNRIPLVLQRLIQHRIGFFAGGHFGADFPGRAQIDESLNRTVILRLLIRDGSEEELPALLLVEGEMLRLEGVDCGLTEVNPSGRTCGGVDLLLEVSYCVGHSG